MLPSISITRLPPAGGPGRISAIAAAGGFSQNLDVLQDLALENIGEVTSSSERSRKKAHRARLLAPGASMPRRGRSPFALQRNWKRQP
jgi:hypothetical protein